MAGGIATLKQLRDGDPYELLEVLGAELDHRMSDALQDAGSPYGFIRRGSVFSLVLVPGRQRLYTHAEVAEQDTTLFDTLYQALLARGFLLDPTLQQPGLLSCAPHVEEIRDLELGSASRRERGCRSVMISG